MTMLGRENEHGIQPPNQNTAQAHAYTKDVITTTTTTKRADKTVWFGHTDIFRTIFEYLAYRFQIPVHTCVQQFLVTFDVVTFIAAGSVLGLRKRFCHFGNQGLGLGRTLFADPHLSLSQRLVGAHGDSEEIHVALVQVKLSVVKRCVSVSGGCGGGWSEWVHGVLNFMSSP